VRQNKGGTRNWAEGSFDQEARLHGETVERGRDRGGTIIGERNIKRDQLLGK